MANKKLDPELIRKVKILLHENEKSHTQIAEEVGIGRASIGKISSKLMGEEVEYEFNGRVWN